MAGQLTIDTLRAGSGVLATQNGMTGIAKAWVNFYGLSTATVRTSFNISSVTRNSTGNFTVAFTTAMPDANYVLAGGFEGQTANCTLQLYAAGGAGTAATLKTTTQCQFYFSAGGASTDPYTASVIFSGN